MLFQTTEDADGWMKVVVSPTPMLKLCQLMAARSEVWMVNCAPPAEVVIVAVPCVAEPRTGLARTEGIVTAQTDAAAMRPRRRPQKPGTRRLIITLSLASILT